MHAFQASCIWSSWSVPSPGLYSKNSGAAILLHLISWTEQGACRRQLLCSFLMSFKLNTQIHFSPWGLAYKTLGRSITLSTQNSPFQCKTPSDFLSNSWALSTLRPGLLWAENRYGKWALQFLLSYPNSHPHSTLQTQHLTPLQLESNTGPSADCLS